MPGRCGKEQSLPRGPKTTLEIRPAGVVESRVESRESRVEGREGKRERGGNWKNRGPVDQQPPGVSGTRRVPSAHRAMHVQTTTDGTRRVPDTLGFWDGSTTATPTRTLTRSVRSTLKNARPIDLPGKTNYTRRLLAKFRKNRRRARSSQNPMPACSCEKRRTRVSAWFVFACFGVTTTDSDRCPQGVVERSGGD